MQFLRGGLTPDLLLCCNAFLLSISSFFYPLALAHYLPYSLPSLSPLSPLSLPSLSPLSPLSLPSLSPLSPLSLSSIYPLFTSLYPLSPSLPPPSPLLFLLCLSIYSPGYMGLTHLQGHLSGYIPLLSLQCFYYF